jgi:hypothetical protein
MKTLLHKQGQRDYGFDNPFFQVNVRLLRTMVSKCKSPDPSMHSIAYLKMTSRKGLFAFQGEFSAVLFSAHPNLDNTSIIYAPENEEGYFDAAALSAVLKTRVANVQIVRVPEEKAAHYARIVKGQVATEQVLDYAHPVHIVKTDDLVTLKGTRFLKFRNKVNAIHKTDVSVRPTDFSSADILLMKGVVKNWAPLLFNDDAQGQTDYIDYALSHLIDDAHIQGLIAYQGGQPVGFTLWENPARGYDVANSFIHCCIHERGLSEYLHHEMAKAVAQKNIGYISLGGAESEGLDAFKRKMNPVQSVRLSTISV